MVNKPRASGLHRKAVVPKGGDAPAPQLNHTDDDTDSASPPVLWIERKSAIAHKILSTLRRYRINIPWIMVLRVHRYIWSRYVSAVLPRLGRLNHYRPRPIRFLPQYPATRSKSSLPRISIVTPSFNQGEYIERTLRSILDQDYPNLEYLIQDGASTDGTVKILESLQDSSANWTSEPDSGQADALNRAFSNTKGELMSWLNADDLLLPGALNCVADFFLNHPEIDVVYGDRLLIDEHDKEIGCWVLPRHDDAILSWADFVPQESLFWRRAIWERTGARIDNSFEFAMDWELLVRFREAGARFAHIDRFLGAFRIHDHQKTSAAIRDVGYEEMNRLRKRCLGYVPSQTRIRCAIAPYLAKHLVTHLSHLISERSARRLRTQ